jgi:hypothetical protein
MSTPDESLQQVTTEYIGPKNHTAALFLVSVLALFLELLLIRWIGTEINIFAYLQNTVLVVCFLGLGMGCLTSRQPIVLRNLLIPLFILLLLLSIPGNISLLLSTLGDLVAWKVAIVESVPKAVLSVSAGLIATYILMLFIWEIFVPLGRILGRLMDDHPKPIQAYSVNIAGSLVGIWAFECILPTSSRQSLPFN